MEGWRELLAAWVAASRECNRTPAIVRTRLPGLTKPASEFVSFLGEYERPLLTCQSSASVDRRKAVLKAPMCKLNMRHEWHIEHADDGEFIQTLSAVREG